MGGSQSNQRYEATAAAVGKEAQPAKRPVRPMGTARGDVQGYSWNATVEAAVYSGMPNPEMDEYKGWAYPVSWAELQSRDAGWDTSTHGLPIFVTLRGFGGGQVLATTIDDARIRWHAVIIFDIPRTLGGSSETAAVETPYGRIKWGIPWRVRGDHVTEVPAIVKAITRNVDNSVDGLAAVILKRVPAPGAAGKPMPVLGTIQWMDFLTAESGTPENYAYRLFLRDFPGFFDSARDMTCVDPHAQRTTVSFRDHDTLVVPSVQPLRSSVAAPSSLSHPSVRSPALSSSSSGLTAIRSTAVQPRYDSRAEAPISFM